MRTERHPCGCVSERGTGRERWLALCPEHQEEAARYHAAHLEHIAKQRAAQAAQEVSP
jgi:hypothetical protein